jgi:hypothetical protein
LPFPFQKLRQIWHTLDKIILKVAARLCKLPKNGALDSQPQVIKLTSCLPMVGGSLRLPPPLKLVAMIYLCTINQICKYSILYRP